MAKPTQAHQKLLNENKNLRSRLEEAEETLRAIRSGQVDAFVIIKAENIQTVPLEGADYPYRAMVESMNEGAVTLIPDGTIFFCNPRFAEMVQTPPEKLIGSPFQNLIAPDEQDAFVTLLTASRQVGAKGEFYLQPTTATRVPVQLSVRQLEAEDMKGISIVVTNLTERKYAEEAMRESVEKYEELIGQAADAIFVLDAAGKFILVNEKTCEMLEYTYDELYQMHIEDTYLVEEREGARGRLGKLRAGEILKFERALSQKDGTLIQIEASALRTKRGELQAILRDITERKRAEEQIKRQLQRLSTLREIDIAISSSFDINTTLDIVLQQVIPQLKVDAAAILLFNPQAQKLEYAASRGFRSNAMRATQVKLGEGYTSRAILESKTVHNPDLMKAGGRLVEALADGKEEFVDYYGTPLLIKSEVKGVLEIYHRSSLDPSPELLEFFETLAGQAAIAIDNAQLFEDLQRSNAELEQRVAHRTAQLNQTNIELEHANRAKDEFLATMSHELRTPLNSVLGLSETLLEQRRGPLNDYQQKSLRTIEASGHHLLELINDVLDLSKIEAGKFDYYPQIVGVEDLCHSSLAFVREQALRKSINLIYEKDTNVTKVNADPRRLKQILINLLTNAVKFTPEKGEIILQVYGDAEQERVQFSIIDTGIGIAAQDLEKLFQPFVQVDSNLNRQYEGTGLGLALVQKMIDLHGGSVEVTSAVGNGSRFTVNLPWTQESVTEQTNSAASLSTGAKVGKPAQAVTVLLAEDNMANVLTMSDYLESHGYQVISANDGQQAIDKAIALHPDIILMDIQMPVMDGLEAIRRLRSDSRFKASTPIIALTALAMTGDRERCIAAGANEYLSKPVSLKGLVKIIATLLDAKT
ncbi:MAG: PAS domain S-box protein [Chloroflexota bacterium]